MSSTSSTPPGTPPSQRQAPRRRSARIQRRQIYDCFGDHGAEELSPVQALGKLSGVAMLTTARVGSAAEDPSMAQARPHLSKINEKGLVTTDSQMGAKKQITHHVDGHVLNPPVTTWQRSYVIGILPKDLGEKFEQKMRLVDGVDFFLGRHGNHPFGPSTHYISVTMYQQGDDDEPEFFTSVTMDTDTLAYSLSGVLPEISHVLESETCVRIVDDDALLVKIVDLHWGRPFWLFEKVAEILDEVLAHHTT